MSARRKGGYGALQRIHVECKTCGISESFYSNLSVEGFKLRHGGHEIVSGDEPAIPSSGQVVMRPREQMSMARRRGTRLARVRVEVIPIPATRDAELRIRGFGEDLVEVLVTSWPFAHAAKVRQMLERGEYAESSALQFFWDPEAVEYEADAKETLAFAARVENGPDKGALDLEAHESLQEMADYPSAKVDERTTTEAPVIGADPFTAPVLEQTDTPMIGTAEPASGPVPEPSPHQADAPMMEAVEPAPEPVHEPAPEPVHEPAPEPVHEPAPEQAQELVLIPPTIPSPSDQLEAASPPSAPELPQVQPPPVLEQVQASVGLAQIPPKDEDKPVLTSPRQLPTRPEEERDDDYLLVSKSWYIQGGTRNKREAVRISKVLRAFRWKVQPVYTIGVILDDILSIETSKDEISRKLIKEIENSGYRLTAVTADKGKPVAWFKKAEAQAPGTIQTPEVLEVWTSIDAANAQAEERRGSAVQETPSMGEGFTDESHDSNISEQGSELEADG